MNRLLPPIFVALLMPVPLFAQVTAPVTTPTQKADTTKSSYTLKTLRMAPLFIFSTKDNALVDSARQFRGARPLPDSFYYSGEKHLKNIRQLTFEGENAEAYLSPDDKYL